MSSLIDEFANCETQKVQQFLQMANEQKKIKSKEKIKLACSPVQKLDYSKRQANIEVSRVMNKKLDRIRRSLADTSSPIMEHASRKRQAAQKRLDQFNRVATTNSRKLLDRLQSDEYQIFGSKYRPLRGDKALQEPESILIGASKVSKIKIENSEDQLQEQSLQKCIDKFLKQNVANTSQNFSKEDQS